MERNQIAWYLWAIGTILIVMSWFDIVSTNIGWFGFAVALVGSVISWGLRPPRAERPAEPPEPPEFEKKDDWR